MPIPPRLVITASQVLWHHFHHGLSGLYVSTATLRMGSAHDFRRSDNPICTYTHRCLLWACKLDAACNGVWCFIVKAFTPPHLPHNLVGYTFLCSQRLEPLLHRFVSQLRHTHHRYFIDPRHIGCTTHLWAAFHISITPCLGSSLPTSPGFRHQPFGLRLPEYQGGRFRALPRHSTLWIISSPKKKFPLQKLDNKVQYS